nr:hypothetical protein HUO10_005380 [Paraburkholderia busanensis]
MSGPAGHSARADFLCFLVIGQMIARVRSGVWLPAARRDELLLIWSLACTQQEVSEYVDAAELGALSEVIADALASVPHMRDLATVTGLFADGGRLDYRVDRVQSLYRICAARLATA